MFHALGLDNPHIELDNDLVECFSRLKGQRAIICPNHPSTNDAIVLFALSALLSERFAFLAGRDIFGKAGSFQEHWLQKIGCYSVSRGTADVHAFNESRHILQENKCKLVIFPEGEISHNNAVLRRFHSGPELIAISTLHELRSAGNFEPVYLQPVALRYKFRSSKIHERLLHALREIEEKSGLSTSLNESLSGRLRSIYNKMIDKLPSDRMDGGFSRLCKERIARVEEKLKKDHSSEQNLVRRVHLLMNDVAELRNIGPKETLLAEKSYVELKRIIPFLGIAEENFEHEFSNEELADLLRPLLDEFQISTKIPMPDAVEIAGAETINVADFLPETSIERKDKLHGLCALLRSRIEDRLEQMVQKKAPGEESKFGYAGKICPHL